MSEVKDALEQMSFHETILKLEEREMERKGQLTLLEKQNAEYIGDMEFLRARIADLE